MAIISIIAAVASNGVIGKDNKLPWYIPEDLEWFKTNTIGKPVIMGRKTHESIGKKLPGRLNIVISRNENYKPLHSLVKVYNSLDRAISTHSDLEELVIIGGEQLYKEALPITNKIYLTKIHKLIDGDTFFPEIPTDMWKIVARETSSYLTYMYEFQILERT